MEAAAASNRTAVCWAEVTLGVLADKRPLADADPVTTPVAVKEDDTMTHVFFFPRKQEKKNCFGGGRR